MGQTDAVRAPSSQSAISLQTVTKSFAGAPSPAVTELSLEIPEGEIVALVGPSGCGKTTTLKMINRLIEPTSGSIEVLGRPQDEAPVHELRRGIGYVIQQIGLFPHHTIRRNVATVPELLGWDRNEIRERVEELVELVGLDASTLDRYPSELSGGQRQRVGVARALAADPPILLMDEPYSAVDPIVRERLQDELLDLQRKVHKTIVIVTHDVDEAIRLADRVAILDVGGLFASVRHSRATAPSPGLGLRCDVPRARTGPATARAPARLRHHADARAGARPGTIPVADATAVMEKHATSWVAIVDDDRLTGWVGADTLAAVDDATAIGDLPVERFVARARPETPLREALDTILTSRSRIAAVIDDDDRFVGMITIDQLAEGLE